MLNMITRVRIIREIMKARITASSVRWLRMRVGRHRRRDLVAHMMVTLLFLALCRARPVNVKSELQSCGYACGTASPSTLINTSTSERAWNSACARHCWQLHITCSGCRVPVPFS